MFSAANITASASCWGVSESLIELCVLILTVRVRYGFNFVGILCGVQRCPTKRCRK